MIHVLIRNFLMIITLWFLGVGCFAQDLIQEAVSGYFETYSSRKDFDKFMQYYAGDAVLKDVVYGVEVHGQEKIRNFFDWGRGSFSLVKAGPILVITDQVISDNNVVTAGYFEEFYFNDQKLGPWEFIIWQQYNEFGKIKKQDDWINYSPKKIMVGESIAE